MTPETKDTNPKDALGIKRIMWSVIPVRVLWYVALAMLEGALKYGRHNYRVAGVRASVYYDACTSRHLTRWWEGEDYAPDSKLHHIDHALASLLILRDSILTGNWVDDRPPVTVRDMDAEVKHLNAEVERLLATYPNPKLPYTEVGQRAEMAAKQQARLNDEEHEARYEEFWGARTAEVQRAKSFGDPLATPTEYSGLRPAGKQEWLDGKADEIALNATPKFDAAWRRAGEGRTPYFKGLTPKAGSQIGERLTALGWVFTCTGPEEWEWVKYEVFNNEQRVSARQGSPTWKADLDAIAREGYDTGEKGDCPTCD